MDQMFAAFIAAGPDKYRIKWRASSDQIRLVTMYHERPMLYGNGITAKYSLAYDGALVQLKFTANHPPWCSSVVIVGWTPVTGCTTSSIHVWSCARRRRLQYFDELLLLTKSFTPFFSGVLL